MLLHERSAEGSQEFGHILNMVLTKSDNSKPTLSKGILQP